MDKSPLEIKSYKFLEDTKNTVDSYLDIVGEEVGLKEMTVVSQIPQSTFLDFGNKGKLYFYHEKELQEPFTNAKFLFTGVRRFFNDKAEVYYSIDPNVRIKYEGVPVMEISTEYYIPFGENAKYVVVHPNKTGFPVSLKFTEFVPFREVVDGVITSEVMEDITVANPLQYVYARAKRICDSLWVVVVASKKDEVRQNYMFIQNFPLTIGSRPGELGNTELSVNLRSEVFLITFGIDNNDLYYTTHYGAKPLDTDILHLYLRRIDVNEIDSEELLHKLSGFQKLHLTESMPALYEKILDYVSLYNKPLKKEFLIKH